MANEQHEVALLGSRRKLAAQFIGMLTANGVAGAFVIQGITLLFPDSQAAGAIFIVVGFLVALLSWWWWLSTKQRVLAVAAWMGLVAGVGVVLALNRKSEVPLPIPLISFYLPLQMYNYAPGMAALGVQWKSSYRPYRFIVETDEHSATIQDLYVELYLPTVIVAYSVKPYRYMNGVRAYQDKEQLGPAQKTIGNVITETHDFYSNELKVNIDELRPGAQFIAEIVLDYSDADPSGDENGNMYASYRSVSPDGRLSDPIKERLRVTVLDSNDWTLKFTTPEAGKHYSISMMTRFKTPMALGAARECEWGRPPMSELCPELSTPVDPGGG